MIIDERSQFAVAVAAASEPGTPVLLGDVIDLEVARDIGNGQPLYAIFVVTTKADGGATATATNQLSVVSDSVAAIAVDGTASVHASTGKMLLGALTAGKTFVLPLSAEGVPYEQFLGVMVESFVEGEDDLAVSVFLSLDPTGWKAYADGAN